MARRALTTLQVETAKAGKARREIADPGQRGLALTVQPNGKKSWCVRYRRLSDRKSRKLTLPGFATLALARKAAADALTVVEQGGDPAADKRAERRVKVMAGARAEAT